MNRLLGVITTLVLVVTIVPLAAGSRAATTADPIPVPTPSPAPPQPSSPRSDASWVANVRVEPQPFVDTAPVTYPPVLGAHVEQLVTASSGGVIESDDGALSMRFGPGALARDARVGIQRRQLGDPSDPPFAFYRVALEALDDISGDEIHSFAVPVYLELRVPVGLLARASLELGRPVAADEVRWWQFDESAGWLDQPSSFDPITGVLRVALRHFSDGSAGISPTGTPATPPSMDAFGTDLFTGWPSFALPLQVPPGTSGVQPDLGLTYFGGQIDINEHGYPASNLQASSIGWGWDLNPGAVYRNRPDDWGGVTGVASLKLGNRSSTLVMNRAETGAVGAPSGRYHTEPETFARVDQLWQSLPTPGANWWGYGDSSGGYMQSYRPGVRVSFTFTGTEISWWTRSAMNEGTVFALIDGQFITKYRDVSGNGGGQPASKKWTASGLPPGNHTLVLALSNEDMAQVLYLSVDAFEPASGRVEENSPNATYTNGWLLDYWQVTTKDGTRYRFGSSVPANEWYATTAISGPRTVAGSLVWSLQLPGYYGIDMVRRPQAYLLDEIRDLAGNRVTFTYDLAIGELYFPQQNNSGRPYVRASYLREIRYTLNDGAPIGGERRVKLTRQSRTIGGFTDYWVGDPWTQRFGAADRIATIETAVCASSCTLESNWSPARRWLFDHAYYATGNTGANTYLNRLLLTSLQEQDPVSLQTLPATAFEYGPTGSAGGFISRVNNGYGGRTDFAYQQYDLIPGWAGCCLYYRVTNSTTYSGMTVGGQPESFTRTYAYPIAPVQTPMGASVGHARVDVTDGLGTTIHEFNTTSSGSRLDLFGTKLKTTTKNTNGTTAAVDIETWAVRKSVHLPDLYGDDYAASGRIIERIATEHWSSDLASKQVARLDYRYDDYGNEARVTEHGDVAVGGDERTSTVQVTPNTGPWLVDLPKRSALFSGYVNDAVFRTVESPTSGLGVNVCGAGGLLYQSVLMIGSGQLRRIQLHTGAQPSSYSGGTVIYAGVYADNGADAPGTKLAEGGIDASQVVYPAAWHAMDVFLSATNATSGTLTVTAGQKVWIGVRTESTPSYTTDPVLYGSGSTDTYASGHSKTSCAQNGPPDFAVQTEVLQDADATLTLVAESRSSYDEQAYGEVPTLGRLTRSERRSPSGSVREVSVFENDSWGNRTRTTSLFDPFVTDLSDRRNLVTDVIFDSTYKTFPVTTTQRAKDLGSDYLSLTTTRSFSVKSGIVLSETNANNETTTFEYDGFFRLTAIRRPGDESPAQATISYEYTYGTAPNRLTTTAKDGSVDGGLRTVTFYDGLGRLIETKTEDANNVSSVGKHAVVRRLYTHRGLLSKEYVAWLTPAQSSSDFLTRFETVESVNPAQPFSVYSYDGAGRSTRVTHPDASFVAIAYGDGLTTTTNERGQVRKDFQDGFGRLAKVEEYTGSGATLYATTNYTYNTQGLLKRVQDSATNNTDFTFDALGRRTQLVDPDSGTIVFTYDGLGRLSSQTDAKLQRLDFSYDLASRLTQRTGTPSGGSATTLATYAYDAGGAAAHALGRRTSMTGPSGSTTYTYDMRGRTTSTVQTILGSAYTTGYAYDTLDRTTTMTYPDGEQVITTYGANGLPTTLAGTSTYISAQTYDALSRPLVRTFGNGVTATFDYYDQANELDADGAAQPQDFRLRSLTYANGGTTLQKHAYRYDRVGNVSKWWETLETGAVTTWTFTYDDVDRLTSASAANPPSGTTPNFNYAYDTLGRITSGPLGTYTYGDAAHKHAVTTAGSNSYAYDPNGALTGRTESGVGYNHTYNVEGRQIQVSVGGGANHGFVYDGDGQLVARQLNGTTTSHFVAGRLYDKAVPGGAVTKYYKLGGSLVALRDSSVHYLGHDHLGSTTLQMSAAATVEGVQLRAPYGATWYSSGTLSTDRQYTAQRSFEASLGSLFDFGARWYNPVSARFLSPDPVAFRNDPRSLDAYAYVRGNPIRRVDSSGLSDSEGAEVAVGGGCDAACLAAIAAQRALDNDPIAREMAAVQAAFESDNVLIKSTAVVETIAFVALVASVTVLTAAAADVAAAGRLSQSAQTASNFMQARASALTGTASRAAPAYARPILSEAQAILKSKELETLRAAAAAGEQATVTVNGRAITYVPGMPANYVGMTDFGRNGFFLGPAALESEQALAKVLLHELYRLATSKTAAGLNAELARIETMDAYAFAEMFYKLVAGGR